MIDLSWPVAFALGAALSATDALAPVQVLESEAAEPRLLAVIRGESLFNDGVAFALVGVAGTAAAAQEFEAAKGLLELVLSIGGGVGGGIAVAWVVGLLRNRSRSDADRGGAVAGHALRRLRGRRAGARLGHPGRRRRRPVGRPPLARLRGPAGAPGDPVGLARDRVRPELAAVPAGRAAGARHRRHGRPADGARAAGRRGGHRRGDRAAAAVGADHRARLAGHGQQAEGERAAALVTAVADRAGLERRARVGGAGRGAVDPRVAGRRRAVPGRDWRSC